MARQNIWHRTRPSSKNISGHVSRELAWHRTQCLTITVYYTHHYKFLQHRLARLNSRARSDLIEAYKVINSLYNVQTEKEICGRKGHCKSFERTVRLDVMKFVCNRVADTVHSAFMHVSGIGHKLAYNRSVLIGGALLSPPVARC